MKDLKSLNIALRVTVGVINDLSFKISNSYSPDPILRLKLARWKNIEERIQEDLENTILEMYPEDDSI